MGGNIDLKDLKNLVQPTVTVPESNYSGVPQVPNVCPGCGRCKECGQPAPTPYIPYPYPYYDPWKINYGPTGVSTMRSGHMTLLNKGTQGE